jgi:hypothetical protein
MFGGNHDNLQHFQVFPSLDHQHYYELYHDPKKI